MVLFIRELMGGYSKENEEEREKENDDGSNNTVGIIRYESVSSSNH